MIRKTFMLFLLVCSFGPYLPGQNPHGDDIFNPKGWRLPGTGLFDLDRTEKVILPDVPREIIAERWISKNDSASRRTNLPIDVEPLSPNLPLIDNVIALTIYKTPDGRIIGCQCTRDFRDAKYDAVGVMGCVVSNLVCDLDGDGSYESQFETGDFDPEYAELLASISRIKLGLSDEAWLVSRMLKSTLNQLAVHK